MIPRFPIWPSKDRSRGRQVMARVSLQGVVPPWAEEAFEHRMAAVHHADQKLQRGAREGDRLSTIYYFRGPEAELHEARAFFYELSADSGEALRLEREGRVEESEIAEYANILRAAMTEWTFIPDSDAERALRPSTTRGTRIRVLLQGQGDAEGLSAGVKSVMEEYVEPILVDGGQTAGWDTPDGTWEMEITGYLRSRSRLSHFIASLDAELLERATKFRHPVRYDIAFNDVILADRAGR